MAQTFQECFNNIHYLGKCAINGLARPIVAHGRCGKEAAWMAVNPVDAMTWKARELKISYGILLTQITEEERQEILEEYEEMLQKKEAEHQERLRQKALLPKPPQKRPQMKSLFYKDPEERLR